MDEMKELFESIDSNFLTEEIQEKMSQIFNEAVEKSAEEKAETLVEERLDEKIEKLNEEYENKIKEFISEHETRINGYLDLVIEEYLKENKIELDESLKVEKVNALLEGFESLLITGGISINQITESDTSEMNENHNENLNEKVDALIEENGLLKEKVKELTKSTLINELSSDLSLVKAEKFKKLAEMIDFTEFNDYLEKLNSLKEDFKGDTHTTPNQNSMNESKNSHTTDGTLEPSWKKFI